MIFSFIGFLDQEIIVGNNTNLNITLESGFDELEEVVFDKAYSDETVCNPLLHTAYRSVLGKSTGFSLEHGSICAMVLVVAHQQQPNRP